MPENFLSEYAAEVFIFLLMLGSLVIFFIRQNRNRTNADPKVVINLLNQLGPDYEVVTNIVVPGDRGMFNVGNVMVSPYGVFVVMVRQTAGKIFGKEGDPEWEVKLGRKRDFISNPLWENRKHINALEKVIGAVPFISLVVFPSGKLRGDFGNNVIRLSELRKFIFQNKTLRLSMGKQEEILKAIRKR